jgi:hypothetical protein
VASFDCPQLMPNEPRLRGVDGVASAGTAATVAGRALADPDGAAEAAGASGTEIEDAIGRAGAASGALPQAASTTADAASERRACLTRLTSATYHSVESRDPHGSTLAEP